MSKMKHFLIISIILIFLLSSIFTISYAKGGTEAPMVGIENFTGSSSGNNVIENPNEIKVNGNSNGNTIAENSSGNNTSENTVTNTNQPTQVENILISEEQARQNEKAVLTKMEAEYRAERNKIPNAGDTTIMVLRAITIVSTIALIVVIVCSRKRKV